MTTTDKTITIDAIVARWRGADRPLFKGTLITPDGPDGNVCRCAQGDVLHVAGYTDHDLYAMSQHDADKSVAKLLGISVAHSILLRNINDKHDGSPQDVLAHPEKLIGPNAPLVLAFWKHLDTMTKADWFKLYERSPYRGPWTAAEAAETAAEAAAVAVAAAEAEAEAAAVAEEAAAAAEEAEEAAEEAAAAAEEAEEAAEEAAAAAAWYTLRYTSHYATQELIGRRRLKNGFYFLKLFGLDVINDALVTIAD
jgi:hypothetical protein